MGSAMSSLRHRCCDEGDDYRNEVIVASPWQQQQQRQTKVDTDAIERPKQMRPLLLLPSTKRRPKCVQWSGSPSFFLSPFPSPREEEEVRRGREKGGSFVLLSRVYK